MSAYKSVLVAFELVGHDDYLLDAAVRLAGTTAHFRFMHVYEAPVYPADSYLGQFPFRAREEEIAIAELQFDELANKYSLANVDYQEAVGRPAREIHRAAKEISADLIVVGSHGRHGVQLLLGSTANAILHGAKCDVLAVRMASSKSVLGSPERVPQQKDR
ncbi:MAG: universal stress protein A [Halioglobus sp.]|jgi:universal stress protein A